MAADPTSVDLDAAPAVPGGGPASRRRPALLAHPAGLVWCIALVAALASTGAVVTAWVRGGGLSGVGQVLFVVCGVSLTVVLAALPGVLSLARDARVDDDMTTYAWGNPCVLRSIGYADEATIEVRGEVVARLPAAELDGRRALVVGDEELTMCAREGRTTLRGRDGLQAEALAHTRGELTDHEIALDGRLLRMRRATTSTVPRATLLDDLGRAWPVTFGRRTVTVRLPDEVHHGGAAFLLVLLAGLTGDIGHVAGPAPTPPPRRRRGRKGPERA